jgi:hypothetical protein
MDADETIGDLSEVIGGTVEHRPPGKASTAFGNRDDSNPLLVSRA